MKYAHDALCENCIENNFTCCYDFHKSWEEINCACCRAVNRPKQKDSDRIKPMGPAGTFLILFGAVSLFMATIIGVVRLVLG